MVLIMNKAIEQYMEKELYTDAFGREHYLGKDGMTYIKLPDPPISTIYIGDGSPHLEIGVDKKFNWFQKKMIKWCFGFEVKENA